MDKLDKSVQGVYSALLTPRHSDGAVDRAGLAKVVAFQVRHGIGSYAINGATGEFCLTTPKQLQEIFATVRQAHADAQLLCGVGGAGLAQVLELAGVAEQEGASALLVPAPYFFPYSQNDLQIFFETVASRTKLPVMLYNLPQFTTGLEVETACRLIRDVPNIVGIKDSSGSLDILRALTEGQIAACRIVGNDSALVQAIGEGVCDGVVSGVACVLPELIQAAFAASGPGASALAGKRLTQFIEQLDVFPTPWGLRWGLEALGVTSAWSAQPISAERLAQSRRYMDWLRAWHADQFSPSGAPAHG